jgi:hypothetical protein
VGGPRTKVEIGAPIHTHKWGFGELPVEERPVTVQRAGETHSARCYFKVVNNKVVYSIGDCAQKTFDGIVDAFERVGERDLVGYLL